MTTTAKRTKRGGRASTASPLKSIEAVTCDVVVRDGEKRRDLTVEVTGTKEIRDERLRDAILEHLEAVASYSEIVSRCRAEEASAERRLEGSGDALQSLMENTAGYLVYYRGLVWGCDDIVDTNPAAPCLVLVD